MCQPQQCGPRCNAQYHRNVVGTFFSFLDLGNLGRWGQAFSKHLLFIMLGSDLIWLEVAGAVFSVICGRCSPRPHPHLQTKLSRFFFQRIFGVCSRFSRNKRLWAELCNFFGEFHFVTLIFCSLCPWICKNIFVHFFWGTGHEPKLDVSFDFGFWILGFGFWSFDFWILDFGVWIWRFAKNNKLRKKKRNNQKGRKKYIAYRGLILFYQGPLGGTLAIFFWSFWDVMGNPMNGTENDNDKTKKHVFQGLFHSFWRGDFVGLFMYLGFLVLHLEIWSKENKKKTKKKEKRRTLPTGG